MEDNDAVKKRTDTLVWLQSFDRGYVAKPKINVDTIRSMSLDDLDRHVQEAYVKLQCSYVYFALLYLHIIDVYIFNPKNLLDPDEKELNSILFAEESATVLALVHVIPDDQRNTVRSVMWLLRVFAEKTAHFLESDHGCYQDVNTANKSVIWPYKVIKGVLEESTGTMRCQGYDQTTGEPDNFDYVYRIRNLLISNRRSARSEMTSNRTRFWIQTRRNMQVGFVPSGGHHFNVDNLLVSIALERLEELTITLRNKFGVQLEWQSVTAMLEYYYSRAKTAIVRASMQGYIRAVRTFQWQFISVLKAIAMRIVIVHLLQVKHSMTAMSGDVLPPYIPVYMKQHKRVADGLQAFVDCVYLFNDQHLETAIDWMNNLSVHFENYRQTVMLVKDNILKYLKVMSPPPDDGFGVQFDVPHNGRFRHLQSAISYASVSHIKSQRKNCGHGILRRVCKNNRRFRSNPLVWAAINDRPV